MSVSSCILTEFYPWAIKIVWSKALSFKRWNLLHFWRIGKWGVFRMKHFYMGGSTGGEEGNFCMFPLKALATSFSRCRLSLFLSPPPICNNKDGGKNQHRFSLLQVACSNTMGSQVPICTETNLNPACPSNCKLHLCWSLGPQSPNSVLTAADVHLWFCCWWRFYL